MDRTSSNELREQRLTTSLLHRWAKDVSVIDTWRVAKDVSVIDTWRLINPSSRDYSFYSARHKSFSRTDYIFISKIFSGEVYNSVHIPITFSDHNAVLSQINIPLESPRASRWRFNTTLLQNDQFIAHMNTQLTEFIGFNKGSLNDPRVLWESIKSCIRSVSISFASKLNKTRQQEINRLEKKLSTIENKLHDASSSQLQQERELTRMELNSALRHRTEFMIHRSRCKFYFNGSRPSRLLAQKLRKNENLSTISHITDHQGNSYSKPADITAAFASFFSKLYSTDSSPDNSKVTAFLAKANLSQIAQESAEQLDAPISLTELKDALMVMKMGKSPGLDGIPPEFYVTFWTQLGPLLLDMIQFSVHRGSFSRDINTALISLILNSLGKLDRRQLDLYLSRKTFHLLSKGLHQFVRIGLTSPH